MGEKLYLKGTKCLGPNCTIQKKPQVPGQHGTSRRGRPSDYKIQLLEKQKAKRVYGILEKQFRKYIEQALGSKGVTGDALIKLLETRLDNVVYRSGFAVSRAQARQLIRSGFFTVNEAPSTIPSMHVKLGDVIKPVSFEKLQPREGFVLPAWISANVKEKSVKVENLPTLDDVSENVDVSLIIEFYSR